MTGGIRHYYDRGVRLTWIVLGVIVVIGLLDLMRRQQPDKKAAGARLLTAQVFCAGRTGGHAVATLRPPLASRADVVGVPFDRVVASETGVVSLKLPWPVPPGTLVELVVASPDCISERRTLRPEPARTEVKLVDVQLASPPFDLRDPGAAPGFPPTAPDALVAEVRKSAIMGDQYALFDGPTPTCAQCHRASAGEHLRSHGRPPSERLLRLARAAPHPASVECVRCHAPVVAAASSDARGTLEGADGFSCSACHLLRPSILEPAGTGISTTSTFTRPIRDPRPTARGTRADTASPAMAVEMDPLFGGSALCTTCHAQEVATRTGPLVVDPTAMEHDAWLAADGARAASTCQSCHFPSTVDPFLVDGYARLMWGVARPDVPRRAHHSDDGALAKAVELSARWEGNELVVKAANRGASHALPGPFPWDAWRIEVEVDAKPSQGSILDDGRPGVWLRRAFGSAASRDCALPWEAESLVADSRLQAGRSVTWRWTFTAPVRARVSIVEARACAGQGDVREEDAHMRTLMTVDVVETSGAAR